MKFRYYIIDLFSGDVKGTNSEDTAFNYAECDDYFVVDSETGEWLSYDGERLEVKEVAE